MITVRVRKFRGIARSAALRAYDAFVRIGRQVSQRSNPEFPVWPIDTCQTKFGQHRRAPLATAAPAR